MTGIDLPIELARRSDAGAIARGSRDLVEHGLDWAWTPTRVAARVQDRNALVVVARAPGEIAGFAIMRYGDDEAHLDLLGVEPAYRRAGLGRRLVEWLEKPALLGGITTVTLELRASNYDARTFYEQLGYAVVGRMPGYYQDRESALRMRRALGQR
jgi:ribosomal protein S18 acetylase RimI-like enzyme